jgi:hypothetical protein
MPGWVSEPEGKGLIETPGSWKVQGLPNLPAMAAGAKLPPAAWKKPLGASRICSLAVHPSAARSAATTPASAAWPAWNGFDMVPKFSRSSPDWLAAMPNARRVRSASKPRSFASAATDPKTPNGPG